MTCFQQCMLSTINTSKNVRRRCFVFPSSTLLQAIDLVFKTFMFKKDKVKRLVEKRKIIRDKYEIKN